MRQACLRHTCRTIPPVEEVRLVLASVPKEVRRLHRLLHRQDRRLMRHSTGQETSCECVCVGAREAGWGGTGEGLSLVRESTWPKYAILEL